VNFRFPVFLDLTGKNCLVTGEGYEIPSKVQALVDASAKVTYVNPRADERIADLARQGRIRWEARDFLPEDLADCFLVITDSDNNAEIFRMAEERNVLCNAVDDPQYCRFSFGSVHRQGDLTIAISTNGLAPALAVRLRQWLEREIGNEYAEFLRLLKELRPEITERIGDFESRRELWYRIVDSDALAKLRSGNVELAAARIRQFLEEAVSSTSHSDTSAGNADR
jgi:precorrin-2 dehydrogenase / sirohydrochlorin ferrochelatase